MDQSEPLNVEQKQSALRRCALFNKLQETSLEVLAREIRSRTFRVREVVCAHGTPGTEFYVVHSGKAHITVPTTQRIETEGRSEFRTEDTLVREVGPGGFFGEIACFEDGGIRTATVTAAENLVLLIVSKENLMSLVYSRPLVSLAIIQHLASRVRFHTDRMAGLARPHDVEKVEAEGRTRWEVFADWMSSWSAELSFTLLNVVLWAIWLGYNLEKLREDLPTINGLTMWVSLQAILMTTFVLVAQRRAQQREQRRKELQYQWALLNLQRTDLVLTRLADLEQRLGTGQSPT